MLYGHVFSAYRGTFSARTTFGTGRNDQHATILGFYDSPTPAWLEASDWCAAHVIRLRVNPAQGLATQPLNLLPPPIASQDTPGERNTLLFDGMSTFTVDAAGVCRIDRSITTYQSNASGQPDNSYLNTNIMFQAMYAARYIATQITSQFIVPGKILVSNGTLIPPGSPATTPNAMLGAVIAVYAYLASIFIVQNVQTFAQNATAGAGHQGSGADVSAARFQRSGHQRRPPHSIPGRARKGADPCQELWRRARRPIVGSPASPQRASTAARSRSSNSSGTRRTSRTRR